MNYNYIWIIEINFKRKNSPWRPINRVYFRTRKEAWQYIRRNNLHDRQRIIVRVSKYMGAIKSGLIQEV